MEDWRGALDLYESEAELLGDSVAFGLDVDDPREGAALPGLVGVAWADEEHQIDPIVSIQARRLRRALSQYYETQGSNDPIVISVPTGQYAPCFDWRSPEQTTQTEGLRQACGSPRLGVGPIS
mgnify:CR=1 FL=1